MTYYYDQSNRIIDVGTEYWARSDRGPLVNGLAAVGPIIVTPLGIISNNGNGAALLLDGDGYNLTVNGLISADYGAYAQAVEAVGLGIIRSATSASTVTVGSTGTIFGTWAGINSQQTANITNSGTIGGHIGIKLASEAGDSKVTNSGLIYSTDDTHALELIADWGFAVNNTGEIQGSIYCRSAYKGSGVGTITNSGMIGGDISFLSGVSKITNSAPGVIDGSVNLWNGNDSFTNYGWTKGLIDLGGGDDKFVGGSFADNVSGSDGIDIISTGGGNDTVAGGMGNDTINGGAGIDTAVFTGALADYALSYNAKTRTFTISSSSDGTDTVTGVESFQFGDLIKTEAQLVSIINQVKPTVSIAAVTGSADEGDSGTVDYSFTVTLSDALASEQTVAYTVAGNGKNAANISDFSGALSGSVVFAAGETTKTVHVLVAGDTVSELNETFGVTLFNVSGGLTLGSASASATITNDDVTFINGNSSNNKILGTSGLDSINGFAGDDTLKGNAGNDILNGGLGNDALAGGLGNDAFVFDTLLAAANVDKISDFNLVDDLISLESDIFAGLTEASALASGNFVNGLAATAAIAQVLYNKATGDIYFDADGNTLGGQSAIKFAQVSKGLALSFDDFTVT